MLAVILAMQISCLGFQWIRWKSVEVGVPGINSMIGNLPVCADEIARKTRGVDRVVKKETLTALER